jgi:predicted RNA-binding protein with PUA-like domain
MKAMEMSAKIQYWIVKQEPTAYAWEQFVRERRTAWTGVRNFQARNNLSSMQVNDRVLYYHSVVGKEIVGCARVVKTAYPDPTAEKGGWVCVDLAPVEALSVPVKLETLKAHPKLRDIALIRQSRLSVIPISEGEYEMILGLSRE